MVLRSIIRIIKALQPPASVDPKVVSQAVVARARSPRRSPRARPHASRGAAGERRSLDRYVGRRAREV